MRIPDNLPDDLKAAALSLEPMGLSTSAWSLKDTEKLIDFIYKDQPGAVILGGDLYEVTDGKFESRIENWHYNPTDRADDSQLSREKALEALKVYATFPAADKLYIDLVAQPYYDSYANESDPLE